MDDEIPDPSDSDCTGPLPPLALQGLRLFNQGEYWHAHEALENAWRAETGQIRHLYRGILQVGVAYFHITQKNYVGALKLYKRSHRWLDHFNGTCRGIDVDKIKADFETAIAELKQLGPERIGEFNRGLMTPVHFQDPED